MPVSRDLSLPVSFYSRQRPTDVCRNNPGYACFCSNTIASNAVEISDASCRAIYCTGDSTQACGGQSIAVVYRMYTALPVTVTTTSTITATSRATVTVGFLFHKNSVTSRSHEQFQLRCSNYSTFTLLSAG